MTLAVGDPAPDFTLPDAEGNLVCLSDLRGQRVVLYFYPRDNTPGCTKEACGFRDVYADYQAQGIRVLGVSADDARSHQKFAQKFGLPFPLLVDEGAQVATAYGVFGPKKFMGKTYNGIHRTTFVIDPMGKIEAIFNKIKVETHAADLLRQLTTA
ncbi:MAG: thioredoxin-dependent thiol peroxidase [Thermostichus sp. HHBFW_bins_43]